MKMWTVTFYYRDEVIGIETQKASSVVLPLSGYGGEVIRVHHEEPQNRLSIINNMQGVQLARKRQAASLPYYDGRPETNN